MSKEFKFNTLRINFADDKLPEFKEVKGKEWIFYGEKNDYPAQLLELFNRSPKHNAIVLQKAAFITGDGVSIDGNLTTEQSALAQKALDSFGKWDDYMEVRQKFDTDVELYGGGALEVIWSRDKQRIAQVNHVDFSKVRANADHSVFYYAEEWNTYTKAKDVTEFAPYNATTREGRQLFYYMEYRPGCDVYPLPNYIGARQYIATDIEISNWHYNNLKNGFSNGMVIQFFKGIPTEEEMRLAEKQFKRRATGTDNAGGILLQFNERDEQPAQINPIQPTDLDKQFEQLNKTVQEEIFVGHRVTSPMLFGVRVPGELGGRSELVQAYKLFHKSYISPKQKKHDRLFSDLVTAMVGQEVKLTTKNEQPLESEAVDLFKDNVMTQDEARAAYGLPALQPQNATAPQQMNADNPFGWKDSDIEVFSRYGFAADEFEEVHSDKFAKLTADELDVISYLQNNEKTNTAEIANVLKLAPEKVGEIVKKLLDEKLIQPAGGGTIVITPGGELAIEDSGGAKTQIYTLWKYAKDPDVDGPAVKDTTRDFCRTMIGLNRVYTRQDIDAMSAELGYDVWKRRGGWYHDPKRNVNLPFCRHIWEQKVMRKRVN